MAINTLTNRFLLNKFQFYWTSNTRSNGAGVRICSKRNIIINKTVRRYMQTGRGFLGQQASNIVRRHSYPSYINMKTYKAGSYKNPEHLRTETGQSLTQHETIHSVIVNDNLTKAYGLLTSAKKPKPGFTPTVIDSVNYKGQNKDQAVAPFKSPRKILPQMFEENENITQYMKNKEAVLDQILSTVKKIESVNIITTSNLNVPKDDEIFTKSN